jgi:hypothetical protein
MTERTAGVTARAKATEEADPCGMTARKTRARATARAIARARARATAIVAATARTRVGT